MLVRSVIRQLIGSFKFQNKTDDPPLSAHTWTWSHLDPVYTARCHKTTPAVKRQLEVTDQMQYINGIARDSTNTSYDWSSVKSNILSKKGNVNEKNINAVMLKCMLTSQNLDAAKSLVRHLFNSEENLSLGTINTILTLYYNIGNSGRLSDDEVDFIRRTHKHLYDKYEYLDSATCESLIHALAVIGDWKACLKVLEDTKLTNTPSHSAYSTVISTLFKLNEKEEAMNLIHGSMAASRLLMDTVYKSWLGYIIINAKDKKDMLAMMEEMLKFIEDNFVTITKDVAEMIHEVYVSLPNWQGCHTQVSLSGKCHNCKTMLGRVSVTPEEFSLLQSTFADRVLVGDNAFIKTSPEELQRFLDYIKKAQPYDIVIDALNVAYAVRNASHKEKIVLLKSVVKYFLQKNKIVFMIGRQHMLKWPKKDLGFLMANTKHFFTDNLSEDDPFFLTAAIFGGPKTDILSRDKLRGHRFVLNDNKLRSIFLRWQWEHQMSYSVKNRSIPVIRKPLNFTPYAQRKEGWHLPYELEYSHKYADPMNAASPISDNWLCLQPPCNK